MEKTKICPRCEIKKPISEFNKAKDRADGVASYCIECGKAYRKEHYKKNKKRYRERIDANRHRTFAFYKRYKRFVKCSKCGEDRWYVIDFHHTGEKDGNISQVAWECGSIKKIKNEIRKCIPLCSNCHRELHYLQRKCE